MSGAARRDQNESLQSLTREGNSLRKSEQLVDEMMRQGAETVNQLHDQRNTLKGAQRKMMVCCPAQPSNLYIQLLQNQNATLCAVAGCDEHPGTLELIDGRHREETTNGSMVRLPWDGDHARLPLLTLLVEVCANSRHRCWYARGYRYGHPGW